MPTVWDSADKTSGISLTDANHIATGSSGNQGVRASPVTHTSGKWYLEYTGITAVGSLNVGMADAATTLGASATIGVGQTGAVAFGPNGVTMGSAPMGKTVSFAIDLDNKLAWCRYDNGTWVGNSVGAGDPAAGVNGGNISTVITPLYLYTWLQNGGTCTVNAGDRPFNFSAPSGFSAWDNTLAPTQIQTAVIF